ncbi:hypothetical protein B0J15DRAFT_134646 [Fusarium solani]|uniref:Secreted protein n=1 Tax=Fusarium solani TaxID=169388 RepID=A0A9P9L5Y2_FUSSL|nr:uncharacterized protein B0J15DRAFT_134646 [Fusarium solani]KAH7274587.1 hypothetical protein B0J15DRAFT_134646 [Fusarium solani]
MILSLPCFAYVCACVCAVRRASSSTMLAVCSRDTNKDGCDARARAETDDGTEEFRPHRAKSGQPLHLVVTHRETRPIEGEKDGVPSMPCRVLGLGSCSFTPGATKLCHGRHDVMSAYPLPNALTSLEALTIQPQKQPFGRIDHVG